MTSVFAEGLVKTLVGSVAVSGARDDDESDFRIRIRNPETGTLGVGDKAQ